MIRALIHGIGGKMGRVVLEAAENNSGIEVVGGVDRLAGSISLPVPVFGSLDEVNVDADVIVDFSRPDALPGILSFATGRDMAVVLATTGYSPADISRMERAAKRVPVFRSSNMSLGVNLLIDLVTKCAAFLGEECDVEIVESHHRHKADAPSGTALMVADAINSVYGDEREYIYGRHTRSTLRGREIGIHAVRGGNTVGEHSVLFLMNDEIVEVKHSAQSRNIFALGALRAAQFLVGREPKLYDMRDLLLDKSPVTSVKADRNVAMITLAGMPESASSMASVFAHMADEGVNLDMISQTSNGSGSLDLSFSLPLSDGAAAAESLGALFEGVRPKLTSPLVKLTVEGIGMERQSGVASKVFMLLNKLGLLPKMITTSPTEISMLIDAKDEFVLTGELIKAFDI